MIPSSVHNISNDMTHITYFCHLITVNMYKTPYLCIYSARTYKNEELYWSWPLIWLTHYIFLKDGFIIQTGKVDLSKGLKWKEQMHWFWTNTLSLPNTVLPFGILQVVFSFNKHAFFWKHMSCHSTTKLNLTISTSWGLIHHTSLLNFPGNYFLLSAFDHWLQAVFKYFLTVSP